MKILRYNQVFEQKFAFDSNKDSILRFIKKIKEGGEQHILDRNVIYGVIVGDSKVTKMFDDNIKQQWKNYFKQKYFTTDGVWSQRTFNRNRKPNNNRTYNYYITISKDPNNISNFIQKLHLLDESLGKLSDSLGKSIAYKTHTLLDMMVNHNDSLKIYYYNPEVKDKIEELVKNWVIDNNIKLDNRSHYNGVDIKTNGESESYGLILAKIVVDKFEELIKQYKNKYTDEEYYQWLVKYLPDIIKTVKVDYNK